ncbi:hypothetical protein MesoLjLb_40770 [Mesorhizobium sp. L-8-3]|nr:hypothetical protein MesoLjLb_40770 [Mesorhizobium sp. L-8-3]
MRDCWTTRTPGQDQFALGRSNPEGSQGRPPVGRSGRPIGTASVENRREIKKWCAWAAKENEKARCREEEAAGSDFKCGMGGGMPHSASDIREEE